MNEGARESRSQMPPDRRIEFSVLAEADIRSILADTADQWGEVAQRAYGRRLDATLRHIQEYPLTGRTRDELRPGMRSFLSGVHVIFYFVTETAIFIHRVLDGRSDIEARI